ncbi:hypothetical protein K1719_016087, partial [Acacia pycnantha]
VFNGTSKTLICCRYAVRSATDGRFAVFRKTCHFRQKYRSTIKRSSYYSITSRSGERDHGRRSHNNSKWPVATCSSASEPQQFKMAGCNMLLCRLAALDTLTEKVAALEAKSLKTEKKPRSHWEADSD